MNALVPITAMRHIDPAAARLRVELPEGLTIAEIVSHVMPGLPDTALPRVRVVLVTPKGEIAIRQGLWHRVRPHAGVHVVVRLVSGKGVFKSLLMVLVSIAAAALAGPLALLLTGPIGTSSIAYGVLKAGITLALTMVGGLLVNALLPPDEPEKEKPAFAISSWRNRFTPNQPVPDPMGKIRFAPPFAASSWTEVVGDVLYSRALFLIGYGPVDISEMKIGDTLISEYDEVQVEVREGWPDDDPQTLYPHQVFEESFGVDLTRPRPRDDYGNIIAGAPESKPVRRFTATDASGAGILLSFPMGLMKIEEDGDEKVWLMDLVIRYRLAGTVDWTTADPFLLWAKKKDNFFRMIRLEFPERGRYEIEIERMSSDDPEPGDKTSYLHRCTWAGLQSYRPEYPLNFNKPIALVALRVKATHQLNGTLDTFNCIVEPLRRDYDAGTESWVERKTRWAASYALRVLQGPGNPFPAPDEEIDWPAFEAWHDYCVDKGLTYDRVHDFDATLDDVRLAIGAAGRAAIRHDGRKWTVVVDRPREIVATHLSPRNSRDFRWATSYFNPPDALRVQFLDETADYAATERLIPWPVDLKFSTEALLAADLDHDDGTEAEVHSDELDLNNGIWVKSGASGAGSWAKKVMALTEQIELPGLTNPDRIFVEARRRQHEIMHRATQYSCVQQGNIRTATPGDLVMGSRDVIRSVMHSARVKAVDGNMVVLDDYFEMEEGESYAIRFRVYVPPVDEDDDGSDHTAVRTVMTFAGRTSVVYMTGEGEAPEPRSIVHFGPAASDSIPLIIVAPIERGRDDTSVLHMLPSAEIIDTKTDAEIPYPWSGRTGPIYPDLNVPAEAKIVQVLTGMTGTGDPDGLLVLLAPGEGSPAIVVEFEVRHRLAGAGTWAGTLDCAAASASIEVSGYVSGNSVELQPRAIGVGGIEGDWGTAITVVVGNDDADLPDVLPEASATGSLGRAELAFATDDDVNTVKVQIYHNTTGAAPTAADKWGLPIDVTPNTAYTRTHGDPTRVDIWPDPEFTGAAGLTYAANWSHNAGTEEADHVSGAATSVYYTYDPPDGVVLRWVIEITAETAAGTGIEARMAGATPVASAPFSGVGWHYGRLTTNSTNPNLGFRASTWVGSVDNARWFVETPTCISQGMHYYWFEPLNEDDQGGPMSGRFDVLVS